MTNPRVDQASRAGASQAWAGAAAEGAMPVPGAGSAATVGASTASDAPSRAAVWRRRVLRVLRDLAIGAAFTALVPIALSTTVGPVFFQRMAATNTMTKLREAQLVRPFMAPRDASISPDFAGRTLASLQQPRASGSPFVQRARLSTYERPWEKAKAPASPLGRSSSWNGPNPLTVLPIVEKGVNAEELKYLRMIAEAPLWKAYDLVASAPTVDLIGGRFEIPFPANARAYEMPIWRFAATKELAYASVSRAAYYLAIGNKAEAEAVLRRTINFGFVFIDNATNTIDALMGRVIVGIGRSALEQLYRQTGDPRTVDVANAGGPVPKVPSVANGLTSTKEWRELMLAEARNSSMPRSIRLASLNALANSVCTNPRDLVLGPRRDVRDAFDQARRDLARTPGDKALLDLMAATPNLPIPNGEMFPNPVGRVVVGTATIASIIFDNPRFAYCARVAPMIY